MSFRLYDTATRTVRDFDPVVPGEVSIYHCGLTVQAAPAGPRRLNCGGVCDPALQLRHP